MAIYYQYRAVGLFGKEMPMLPELRKLIILSLYFQIVMFSAYVFSDSDAEFGLQCAHIEQWDWSQIDINDVLFPDTFKWGTASSAYQSEGTRTANGKDIENSWTEWEKAGHAPTAGTACDYWDRYKEDIALMKELGLHAYRFSIPHEKIEPQEGQFDEDALQHYADICQELIKNDIEPVITFFHHTWPIWFGKKGGFEKQENNTIWLRFATKVAETLTPLGVNYWFPFNEPVGFCLQGFFQGVHPPGKKNLKLCGEVVRNMVWAHVDFAHKVKEINPDAQVGMPKIFRPIDCYNWWNPIERLASGMFNHLLNNVVLDFFKTGEFIWGYKGYNLVQDHRQDYQDSLDIIGINYYENTILKMGTNGIKPVCMPGRFTTSDGTKACYPEGLWRSIKKAAELKKPMWIMENGASTKDAATWDTYMKQHIKVVSEAIKKGFDIQRYFAWSATDTYNWSKGFADSYGLISIDFDSEDLRRSFRPGIDDFASLVQAGKYLFMRDKAESLAYGAEVPDGSE